jgi:pimeloyl-ACP methyl ester carboxylesterase
VTLARQLARRGIATLRMDFAGLGDSLGAIGKEDELTEMFKQDRTPDIKGAIEALERLGYRRFVLQGLCAGAFHSFHAALADPRISALLLVNIPLFSLPGQEVMDFLAYRDSKLSHYVSRLFSLSGLKRLVSGKVKLGNIVRSQITQAQIAASAKVQGVASKVGMAQKGTVAHRTMAELSARGVRTLFLFSTGQSEIDAFAREFGNDGAGLQSYPGAEMHVIEHMDHDMSQAPGRAVGQALMISFLAPQTPPATVVEDLHPPHAAAA